jgi:hypothetical protein
MKRSSHDSISRIESFFNTITMMNIHIYIQDTRVYAVNQLLSSDLRRLKLTVVALKYLGHYFVSSGVSVTTLDLHIVDVAETTSFRFLGVM